MGFVFIAIFSVFFMTLFQIYRKKEPNTGAFKYVVIKITSQAIA